MIQRFQANPGNPFGSFPRAITRFEQFPGASANEQRGILGFAQTMANPLAFVEEYVPKSIPAK